MLAGDPGEFTRDSGVSAVALADAGRCESTRPFLNAEDVLIKDANANSSAEGGRKLTERSKGAGSTWCCDVPRYGAREWHDRGAVESLWRSVIEKGLTLAGEWRANRGINGRIYLARYGRGKERSRRWNEGEDRVPSGRIRYGKEEKK